MLIQELRYRPATDERFGQRVCDSPPDVDATNVLSFLTQRCGVEPLDVSWTSAPEHERVVIGWVFPATGGGDGPDEIVAIPLREGDDGTVPLFVVLADQRAQFGAMVEDGVVDELHTVTFEQREWRPATGES